MKTEDFFTFEDCDFCGKMMEPVNLEWRNILIENGILRFDICPCCGSNTKEHSKNSVWQNQVMKWIIDRRQI